MSKKPRGEVWDHFLLEEAAETLLKTTVICKYCGWKAKGNTTRMSDHLSRCPKRVVPAACLSSHSDVNLHVSSQAPSQESSSRPDVSAAEPPVPKKAKPSLGLLGHFDRPFSTSEQKNALRKLAIACVKTSTPYNALESEEYRDFFASLRKDFTPLTRYALQ